MNRPMPPEQFLQFIQDNKHKFVDKPYDMRVPRIILHEVFADNNKANLVLHYAFGTTSTKKLENGVPQILIALSGYPERIYDVFKKELWSLYYQALEKQGQLSLL